MALPVIPSDAGMLALQAGVVAAPRALAPHWALRLRRLRGRGWALIPVASIIGVIFMIRFSSGTATWLTYLALVAVPLLAAASLGWLMRGSRPWLAPLAAGLFVLAWRVPGSLEGEAAAALLSGLSCVALGVLLATVTPSGWLKFGIVAMACADVWLVASNLLQAPNGTLEAAAPGAGLPQLQSEQFGTISMGYGDLFVAALLGGVFAQRRRVQWTAALVTFLVACVFDLLFLLVDNLPATVPVATTLILVQVGLRRGWISGCFGRSKRGDAIPPPAT
ncbi:MAG TPA: hypothetical protein VME01_02960 [Solirubrobacteraceae bacterium]|nr:hypothetical protein [Solirubrobacteraceae bacterium]